MIEICSTCKTKYNNETVDHCPKCKPTQALQLGHFKKLVDQKKEENTMLKETRDALAQQVKSLWGMIHLLERRKSDLEEHVTSLEQYLRKGSDVIDETLFNPDK